jgi:creatinine amidohydrolase
MFWRIAVVCLMGASLAAAQVRKLHTRDLVRLSLPQITAYLKGNDTVFIPVGAVETNGILPSGRDYVYPLAYAMALAEQTESLFLPGLYWSYPGTTVMAPSTIYMSPTAGVAHLKTLAKSLLRQGFRRQVWLTASHGPGPLTVGTLAREFFEETHVPILYIDMDLYLPKIGVTAAQRNRVLFGAHAITGRLEDLPLQGDYGDKEMRPAGVVPVNTGLQKLSKLGYSGSLSLGSYIPDVMAHGGGADTELPATAAEREQWGRQGREQIAEIVKKMRMKEALEALREHDQFTQQLLKKFGAMIPSGMDAR